jgi:hypothetical protein
MRGPDGALRNCYPVVMSIAVDYPEVCLLCLIHQNYACPRCMVRASEFRSLDKISPPREIAAMIRAVASAWHLSANGDYDRAEKGLQKQGLWGLKVYFCELDPLISKL